MNALAPNSVRVVIDSFAPMLAAAILSLAAAGPGFAQLVHADYLPVQDAQGKLVIGIADYDNNVQIVPVRLFSRDLDDDFFGSDPGWTAVSQANVPAGYFALPANTPLAFDFAALSLYGTTVSNLLYWDGIDANANGDFADDVNFQPIADTTFTASLGPFAAVVDGAAADVVGFNIQTTTATGGIHRHTKFQLDATSAQGLYLVAMRARMTGLARSDPFYTVFVTEAISSPAYATAVAWAEDHLLIPGDVNTDAAVNIFDINLVSAHWGQQGPTGDANYDGAVNIFDINLVSANWGAQAAGFQGGSAASAVPEPATWALLATGLIAWCVGGVRRKSGWRR